MLELLLELFLLCDQALLHNYLCMYRHKLYMCRLCNLVQYMLVLLLLSCSCVQVRLLLLLRDLFLLHIQYSRLRYRKILRFHNLGLRCFLLQRHRLYDQGLLLLLGLQVLFHIRSSVCLLSYQLLCMLQKLLRQLLLCVQALLLRYLRNYHYILYMCVLCNLLLYMLALLLLSRRSVQGLLLLRLLYDHNHVHM